MTDQDPKLPKTGTVPKPKGMSGQWIGDFDGTYDGRVIINIDEQEDCFEGVVYHHPNANLPSSVLKLRTGNKEKSFRIRGEPIHAIDPRTQTFAPWESIRELYHPEVTFSATADINGSFDDDSLKLSWTTNIGVQGSCELARSKADQPSDLTGNALDWAAFKEHVLSMKVKRPLFRGQVGRQRLRSSFHRTGRADLHRLQGRGYSGASQAPERQDEARLRLECTRPNRSFLQPSSTPRISDTFTRLDLLTLRSGILCVSLRHRANGVRSTN
jgi:hypothetical protein